MANLVNIKPKGILPLDIVRKEIEPKVIREKKAEKLIKDIETLENPSMTIDGLSQKLNEKIDSLKSITFAAQSLQNIGQEPELTGTIFAKPELTKISKPVKGNSGVFVYILDNYVKAPAGNDYSVYRIQLLDQYQQRGGYEVYKALEKNSDVVDNRSIFY